MGKWRRCTLHWELSLCDRRCCVSMLGWYTPPKEDGWCWPSRDATGLLLERSWRAWLPLIRATDSLVCVIPSFILGSIVVQKFVGRAFLYASPVHCYCRLTWQVSSCISGPPTALYTCFYYYYYYCCCKIWAIAADGIVWSVGVCLLVTFVSCEKTLDWSRCHFEGWLMWVQGTVC